MSATGIGGGGIGSCETVWVTDSNKVGRAKTFDELTDSERIQVLRRELQSFRRLVSSMRSELSTLRNHKHLDGELVVPVNRNGIADCEGSYDPLK